MVHTTDTRAQKIG